MGCALLLRGCASRARSDLGVDGSEADSGKWFYTKMKQEPINEKTDPSHRELRFESQGRANRLAIRVASISDPSSRDLRFETGMDPRRATGRDDGPSPPPGLSVAPPHAHPELREVGPAAARPAHADASGLRTAHRRREGGEKPASRSSLAPDALLIHLTSKFTTDQGLLSSAAGGRQRPGRPALPEPGPPSALACRLGEEQAVEKSDRRF